MNRGLWAQEGGKGTTKICCSDSIPSLDLVYIYSFCKDKYNESDREAM